MIATSAGAAGPAPGRYEATLCVGTSAAPPSCGAAQFESRPGGRAQVRVADIVYRLHLRPAQLDVATMQGTMEIDEFSTTYEWQDGRLRFTDADKNVRYEVKLGAKLPATRKGGSAP
ncbi:MAG TPA: hypothetical protein VNS61_12355 [Caldimonas sp.]|nr:hypothetical protein [Caldimonas sp.]